MRELVDMFGQSYLSSVVFLERVHLNRERVDLDHRERVDLVYRERWCRDLV